ncbi:MAG TPA: hypothetical protein VN577_00155 [Terriglobales bacterium]|nr:hypothetical protein [Terriglobales bacterium]
MHRVRLALLELMESSVTSENTRRQVEMLYLALEQELASLNASARESNAETPWLDAEPPTEMAAD